MKRTRKTQAKPADEKPKKAKVEKSPDADLSEKSEKPEKSGKPEKSEKPETVQSTPDIAPETKASVSESKSKIRHDKKVIETRNTDPPPKKKIVLDFRPEAILRVLKTLARAPNAFKV